jgi:hypothetical protein
VTKADVAELVDARDLKCPASFDPIIFSCKTAALEPIENDGTEQDLQNILTLGRGVWRLPAAIPEWPPDASKMRRAATANGSPNRKDLISTDLNTKTALALQPTAAVVDLHAIGAECRG